MFFNNYMEKQPMTSSPKNNQISVHPTHWTVAALKWALKSPEHELAIGEEIETLQVVDRELAVAIAHHLLDKHAHEAFGKTGLEIHIVPPAQLPSDKEPSGFRQYKVSAEAYRQARTLVIRGDVRRAWRAWPAVLLGLHTRSRTCASSASSCGSRETPLPGSASRMPPPLDEPNRGSRAATLTF